MTQLAQDNFPPFKEINVFWRAGGEYAPSRVSELSRTSAFIKTSRPEALGTLVDLRLDLPGREICAQAIVRRVVRDRGMAVEFESMSADDRARLALLVPDVELPSLSDNGPSKSASGLTRLASIASSQNAAQPERSGPRRNHRRLEKRTRLRHKFSATVELTKPGTTQPVPARLTDLGRGGCYVKLAEPFHLGMDLEISITGNDQSFRARAKVASSQPGEGMGLAFNDIAANERLVLDEWLASSMERIWLASNRRKSHRIMVNIPVHVAAKNKLGSEIFEDTKTVSISAHGALLHLEMPVIKGQTLLLRNARTNSALECSVDYLGAIRDGLREVGVSFVVPNQTLWQITFPPEDWSPQHPDAKRS